jgi:hypothetical protein
VLITPRSLQCDDLGRFRLLIDRDFRNLRQHCVGHFSSSSKSRIFCFYHLVGVVLAQVPSSFLPANFGMALAAR